jgi:excisionase family DNA binding protein
MIADDTHAYDTARADELQKHELQKHELHSHEPTRREPESHWPDAMSWRAVSVCRTHPTRWWFAGSHRETVLAKGICGGCAVREPCLEFAMSRPELLGVWAATTPVERANMRRGLLEPPAPDPVPLPTPTEVGARFDGPAALESRVVALESQVVELDVIDLVRASERDRDMEPRRRPRSPGPGRVEIPVESDELLTPAEAARKLGVTPNTVTRWSRAGKISAIQTMGGHRRFRLSEIERVLCDGSTTAEAVGA